MSLYTELSQAATKESARLLDAHPQLAAQADGSASGAAGEHGDGAEVTGDGAFIEVRSAALPAPSSGGLCDAAFGGNALCPGKVHCLSCC